jgi:hypothetical protein
MNQVPECRVIVERNREVVGNVLGRGHVDAALPETEFMNVQS